jgi:hypothetical protein
MLSYATRPSEDAMPTTSCPYCNAAIPSPEPITDRVTCPRCGEMVMRIVSANGMPSLLERGGNLTNAGPSRSDRLSNRTVARVVVVGMLLIAAGTAVYSLATTKQRRANDHPKEDRATEAPASLREVRPAEWAGLGFLPEDTQAIGGIRLAAALESDASRTLLVPLGFSPDVRGSRLLGIAPSETDHVIFAASLKALPPRVTAVVHTRQPLDPGRVRDALPGLRTIDHNGRTISQGKLWAGGPEGVVWMPESATLVATQLLDDIDKVPAQPRTATARLPGLMPTLLKQRIDPAAIIWLAAHAEPKNAALGLMSGLLPLPPAERDVWGRVESLAVSIRADDTKLVFTAALCGQDSATSEALAGAVTKSLTANGVSVETAADGNWHTLTASADGHVLAKWLDALRKGPVR